MIWPQLVQVNEEEAVAQVQANEDDIHEQDADAQPHAGAQPPTPITRRTKSKHSSTLLIDVDGMVSSIFIQSSQLDH